MDDRACILTLFFVWRAKVLAAFSFLRVSSLCLLSSSSKATRSAPHSRPCQLRGVLALIASATCLLSMSFWKARAWVDDRRFAHFLLASKATWRSTGVKPGLQREQKR